MSVTRGKFLKELGKSLPGMLLGGGVAGAAHKVLGKVAAAADMGQPQAAPITPRSTPAAAETAAKEPDVNEFIMRGPVEGNRVALTFDDGPTPGVTDLILDELKRRGVRATFFMIGDRIAAAPELARRVLAEGHEIGNHTMTHPKLSDLSDAKVDEEIRKTQDIMRDVLEHRPKWFRPPYGALRRNQAGLITDHEMRIIFWTVDTKDWDRANTSPEKIVASIRSEAAAGGILLFHDTHQNTVDALARVLDHLETGGLKPVALSSLLE